MWRVAKKSVQTIAVPNVRRFITRLLSGSSAREQGEWDTAGLLARGSLLVRLAFPATDVASGTPTRIRSPLTVAESAPELPRERRTGFPGSRQSSSRRVCVQYVKRIRR